MVQVTGMDVPETARGFEGFPRQSHVETRLKRTAARGEQARWQTRGQGVSLGGPERSNLDYLLGNAVTFNHPRRVEWLLGHGARLSIGGAPFGIVPLALPAILTGIRIVLVQNIGMVTIAALIGGGGFGAEA